MHGFVLSDPEEDDDRVRAAGPRAAVRPTG